MVFSLFGCLPGAEPDPGVDPESEPTPEPEVEEVEEAEEVKIGFLVKDPREPWFQEEWRWAGVAAEELGFTLIEMGTTDGEEVFTAIDALAAKGAQGFIICTPDVRLGPAIVARAEEHGLKVMSVDDRFVGTDGKPMEEVHHMGISAYDIGKMAGDVLVGQIEERGWDINEVGFLRSSFDELPTIKERTDGATSVLLAAGLPQENVFDSPARVLDTESAFTATRSTVIMHPEISYWVVAGGNDPVVVGAVRAFEELGFSTDAVVAVGINGEAIAVGEFEREEPTSFYASIRLSAKRHGHETATNMFYWITEGREPPLAVWTAGEVMYRGNFEELMAE